VCYARAAMRAARWLGALLLLLAAGAALGQVPRSLFPRSTASAPAPSVPEETGDELGRTTPRGALRGFSRAARDEDWRRAGAFLDLGRQRRVRGLDAAELAERLDAVLDRKLWIPLAELSDAPEGRTDDGLPADLEALGTIRTGDGPVELRLQRGAGPGGSTVWRVSHDTVQRIPDLHAAFGRSAVERWIPGGLVGHEILGIQAWHWLALLAVLLASVAVAYGVAPLVVRLTRPLAGLRRGEHAELHDTLGPVRLLVGLLAFIAGVAFLGLPARVAWFLEAFETLLWIAGAAWLGTRILDVGSRRMGERLAAAGRQSVATMVPLGRKTLKVVVVILALMTMLQTFGVNVTALVAGLGIGGIAVALAAQKTVENLFGGVALIVDQPIRVGDFCRIGDVMGTVEEIGLRSTRVRTLDRTVVSIPNGQVSAMAVENFARRDKIWMRVVLSLRLDTSPDQLRDVIGAVRRMLGSHPRLEPGARVRLVGFGTQSHDLEIVGHVPGPDYDRFLAVREDLLLRLLEAVQAAGTGLALPAQIQYDAGAAAIDEARRAQAEQRVAEARASGQLRFPDLPPEERREPDLPAR
jgi:MscS family membrane protein